ncbi:MAG: hypothetical protein R3E83_01765 [Burkholderiaceae bacterium]
MLLTDLGLPDGSGIEMIAGAVGPDSGYREIAVMTVFADEATCCERSSAGHRISAQDGEDVLAAMSGIGRPGPPISPAIARHVLAAWNPEGRSQQAPAYANRNRRR